MQYEKPEIEVLGDATRLINGASSNKESTPPDLESGREGYFFRGLVTSRGLVS
jgi:hypothetical protein